MVKELILKITGKNGEDFEYRRDKYLTKFAEFPVRLRQSQNGKVFITMYLPNRIVRAKIKFRDTLEILPQCHSVINAWKSKLGNELVDGAGI